MDLYDFIEILHELAWEILQIDDTEEASKMIIAKANELEEMDEE